MEVTRPNAAGIDIGSRFHYVAVPKDRDEQTVRSFSAYSEGLDEMAKWLKACGITTVAMESTGNYWIGVWNRLVQEGLEVVMVDARSVKHVPGRKTDVKDCQWIQQLHSCGLLRAAFRPEQEVCALRTLQRHRKSMIEAAAMHVQHIQKALNEQNLYLHHVLSDITGESGLRILDAILTGSRSPNALARLVDHRVKKSAAEIGAALNGNYRQEQLFVIGQSLTLWRGIQALIQECDEQILGHLQAMSSRMSAVENEPQEELENLTKPAPKKRRTRLEKSPVSDAFTEQLKRIIGVDLTKIPGLGILAVLTLLSEIGTDMSRWRNEKAFASWLGLCPNHKISGGRILSSKSRKVVNRAATILRMAAMVLGKTDTPLGSFYRRKRAHIGAPKANTATARKLACLIYRLMASRTEYQAGDVKVYELKFKDQMVNSLRKRAASLGYNIVELSQAA